MKKIIALRGKANTGKTTTIRLLPALLLANDFSLMSGIIPEKGDFAAIFEKEKIRVGVTSAGDSHDLVEKPLKHFIDTNCDICVCACRTYDRVPPGTVAAVDSFPTHPPQFVLKTIASSEAQEDASNAVDANTIFSLI